jgi:branched-chain amino acid transport system substrate-binding protein
MSSSDTVILILAANPKRTTPIRLAEEIRDIQEGLLQRSQSRHQFTLVQQWAARPRDIRRAMLDVNPKIVHFSGHGTGKEGLAFEDALGNVKFVDAEALAGLFKLFAEQVECVVLNACYSQVQAQAIAQHIPYVVGMSRAIGDRAAIEFSVGFYDALGVGRDIEFAHQLGCNAIRLEGIQEHLTPVLITGNTTAQPEFQLDTENTAIQSLLKAESSPSHPLKNTTIVTPQPDISDPISDPDHSLQTSQTVKQTLSRSFDSPKIQPWKKLAASAALIAVFIAIPITILRLRKSYPIPSIQFSTSKRTIAERISFGERPLIPENTTSNKQEGIAAFARQNYEVAIRQFETSLKTNKNDPETLIYLNNAKAASLNPIKIVVSVPIGKQLDIAQEILRGVAQAQDHINQTGGINSRGLQVAIIDDENDPEIAKQIATYLINDPDILGVIGHNASDVSRAAAPIYESGGLVMVSPTSVAYDLTRSDRNYIFRTTPRPDAMAKQLAEYIRSDKTKIAIVSRANARVNQDFIDNFIRSFEEIGGEVKSFTYDSSSESLNADVVMDQVVVWGAEGVLLSPHVNDLASAIEIARANWNRRQPLALYSSPSLYTGETLTEGKAAMNGLVISVPWHRDIDPESSFFKQVNQLWGGPVNWRTALSYDAALAIAEGLRQSNTRDELATVLRQEDFVVPDGTSGGFKFTQAGDRSGNPVLIQVVPDDTDGYTFKILTQP